MPDCPFCDRRNTGIRMLYEDDLCMAFLARDWASEGHTLVIPKAHHVNLLDTPASALRDLIVVTQRLAPAVLRAAGKKEFLLLMNNGSHLQTVHHAHLHIIPTETGVPQTALPQRRATPAYYDAWHARIAHELRKN